MAIKNAFLTDKITGEIVNYIVVDTAKPYTPPADCNLVFPLDAVDELSKATLYTENGEI